MSKASASPLETLLNIVAASAPDPWYPRRHAEETDVDPDVLGEVLEMAWLEKLVEKSGSGPETGPGFVLTELGEQVRHDPEALQRLRDGLPLVENDPGAIIRSSLRLPFTPGLSKIILFANFLVFGYGISLSWHNSDLLRSFLTGFPSANAAADFIEVLHRSGSVEAADILKGQWWRLLTTCFVHAGLLHLGMNMYMLYNAGAFIEQTWGRVRFFVIYALAGWGGSCLAVAYMPQFPVVGASSALCGIFGAEAVWVLLYGKYLPRSVARRGRSQIVVNVLLLVFISLLPRVSGWAHLGGGLAGAAAALVLHFQRFGPPALRWAAVAALVPLPWISYAILNGQRANSPKWQKVLAGQEQRERNRAERRERQKKEQEEKERAQRGEQDKEDFKKRFLAKTSPLAVGIATRAAEKAYVREVAQLLEQNAARRPPDEVKKARARLAEHRKKLREIASALEKAGPYQDGIAEKARLAGRDYTTALDELFRLAERCLSGGKWGRKDDDALAKQYDKAVEQRDRWGALVEYR
jgi:membrane associated rhomboid family serine protease